MWLVLLHLDDSLFSVSPAGGNQHDGVRIRRAGQRVAEDREFALPITLAVLWAAFAANFFGMKVAKWISALGGSSTFIIGAVLGLLAIAVGLHSGIATRFDLLPKANLNTLNFWSQIAFAFVGLELAPIVSAEIRNPRRDLPRAALISGIVSAVFYIGVTAALLVLLKPEEISPMTGLAQAGAAGARKLGAPVHCHSARNADWNRIGRPTRYMDRRKYPLALRHWA